jgi:hypothetical protein
VDANRFDDLTRLLCEGSSRRRALRHLAMASLGGLAMFGVGDHGGQARRRKRKVKLNKFGCIDVGGKCYGKDARCCSGICEGSGKQSRCRAHHQGTCTADDSSCPEQVPCGSGGECYRTTGKAGFCAQEGLCDCAPCAKDKDCEAQFGEGAACIVCISNTENTCVNVKGSKGTACVPAAAGVAP